MSMWGAVVVVMSSRLAAMSPAVVNLPVVDEPPLPRLVTFTAACPCGGHDAEWQVIAPAGVARTVPVGPCPREGISA